MNCAISAAVSGSTIRTPNCCAVLASFTREEMTSAICSDTSAAAGTDETYQRRRSQIDEFHEDTRLGKPTDADQNTAETCRPETASVGIEGAERLCDKKVER